MKSTSEPHSYNVTDAFAEAFRDSLGGRPAMSWSTFTELALYHPEVGYYRQPKGRVGRSRSTDFYTASSLGEVFGRLVTAASRTLLNDVELKDHCLVEIGSEPGQSVFANCAQHYAEHVQIPLGSQICIPPKAVVFANELLDAQPFHRLQFAKEGGWQEMGVTLRENQLLETPLDHVDEDLAAIIPLLPADAAVGYRLDLSLAGERLLTSILEQKWQGLFLFFDYGRSWQQLIYETPHGTARAFRSHQQEKDLLAHPGLQDLTCDVCWDRLADVAAKHHFQPTQWQRQEAFFMHHATQAIADMMTTQKAHLAPERRTLQELLHPSYFGHRFQVMYGRRNADRP